MVGPVFFSNFDEVQMDGTTVDEILAKCPLPGSDQNDGGGGSEGCSKHSFSSQKNLVEDISLEEVIPGSQPISPPATPVQFGGAWGCLGKQEMFAGWRLKYCRFPLFFIYPQKCSSCTGTGDKSNKYILGDLLQHLSEDTHLLVWVLQDNCRT